MDENGLLMSRFLVSSLVLALFVVACSSVSSETIEGVWLYESFNGTPVVVGETAAETPVFRFRDGDLRATAGCNQILSGYEFDGETLRFVGGAITEAGCEDSEGSERVMASERAYLEVTRAAPAGIDVDFDGDAMTWTTPGGQLVFSLATSA